ncbi:hypothetical protein QZH41_002611 [Actinostola sp. cb2023]|nr:hypothetical protein QZH41_002611 [Actinostola sp. cb2023]
MTPTRSINSIIIMSKKAPAPAVTEVQKGTMRDLFTSLPIKVDPTRRWVDLTKTLFVFEVEFLANDNTALLVAANKLVSSGLADYHYVAYLDRLLRFSKDEKTEALGLEGWFTDETGKFDDTDPLPRPIVVPTDNTTANILAAMNVAETRATPNAGAAARHGLCCQGRKVTFYLSPVVGIFDQGRYLTPGTQIDFRVRWNSPAVALMSGDATLTSTPKFRIVPQSPAMWIYHVETNPELHLRNEVAMLQNQQIAFYPMEEKRIVTHTIINGRLREKFSNLFTGFRPNYMIVGLLRGDAYTGSYARNPYNFGDMGQKQIKVTIDGEELPYPPPPPPPIVLDSHDKCEGYATFPNFAGKFFDSQSNGISRKDYKDGNYLLLWNFNPDGALNSGYVYGRTLGNVAIDIEFSAPTTDNTTLVIIDVVALYPPNRGTHTNYTYVGTKAADEALAELERLQQGPDHEEWGMVFNIDPAHRPGQHWLALYSPAGEKTVECMDSYGTPEASRYPDSPEAQTILRRVSPVKSPRLQSYDTFACGHYCLAYLYARTHDKSPQRFVAPFSSTEHVANDRTVCRFVCSVMIPKRLRPAFTAAYVGPLGSPCQGCCCPKEVNKQ